MTNPMDKIDLTKHAEAILGAASGATSLCDGDDKHCPDCQAILTACAALADDAARAMQEAAGRKATGFLVGDPKNGVPLRNPMAHEISDAIRAIDPATLRT